MCLLIAENKNKLLMKNHQAHPTNAKPFYKANTTSKANAIAHSYSDNQGHGHSCGHNYYQPHNSYNKNLSKTRFKKIPLIGIELHAISGILSCTRTSC